MKIFRWLIVVSLLTFKAGDSSCQIVKTEDFYDSIKYYDLSKLWCADSMLNLDCSSNSSDPKYFTFPEPLGFIGDNFQRFEIHLLSIKKNKNNPYIYNVTGKTRVKANVSRFSGTITIDTAEIVFDTIIMSALDAQKMKRGYAICHIAYYEDKRASAGGCLRGTMETDWCIYAGQMCYDNYELVADGYSNNQFTGNWKSYKSGATKKCNWGDFRIPESIGLDVGTGEFIVSEKYLKNGWQNYMDTYIYSDSIKQKKEMEIENKKWWK